ncbi:polyketide synthase [Fomitiporia mediterranea MF3/22]|uniref:polyketide synthase n=1 Tax=Fomitiporia mediterranea (strain MF3/22) TaxID=694068 RepID=UPI0004407D91|nr:polyketide synthase [Fomitiporia mediterranea MF3/22]EJD00213.1 polyketide synthase [Fomitiporia mediterranea MF3/22]
MMDPTPETDVLPAIAIVGISAELPSGAHSPINLDFDAFQEILLDGKDVYEIFPRERLSIDSWRGRGLGRIITNTGAFVKNLTLFDYLEFGVSARDAKAMAVGGRKLLEQSFLALLDSGIDYRSRNVGCYVSAVDFDINNVTEPDVFEARGSFAGAPCMVANRISYYLDLLGPSIPLDTACSSSLTATHLAVQALRNGDCEAAIVGGSQINHRLIDWINYSQGSVLSLDGKCKPFDASADGFGRGEGTVVVVLKLLSDAIRDGDHIYASILGTGINSCGCAAPVSAPVADAQKDAMLRAYSSTGRSPSEVDFIELHATGTAAGDPTEANWVGEAFKRNGELLLGSVKGNLGHLEITAFLASLIKVCSIFRNGVIPPTANFSRPNPAIKWAEYNLRVVIEPTVLLPRHKSGRALVSITSSGIGGSNGHAVVESFGYRPIPNGKTTSTKRGPALIITGGLTPRSATANAEMLVDTVSTARVDDWPMLSVILGRRARQMTWRTFAVVVPNQHLDVGNFSSPNLVSRSRPPLVFVFSGQGPQHINMGRQLFASYSVFRESILRLDQIYEEMVGQSLMKAIGLFDTSLSSTELPSTWPICIVLPAIAMVQIALVDLLRSFNVIPDIVIGHSAGETAVMYASGAASKEMAFSVAIARGTAMSVVEEMQGTMAAISCSATAAQSLIDTVTDGDATGKVEIACFNAPESVTISGLESFVTKAVELAKECGHFATILRTRVPVHSSIMETCRQKYEALIQDVFKAYPGDHRPRVTTYSTLTGQRWNTSFTPGYFWENARNPVRFTDAMSALLLDSPNATFVEVSPHPVLSSYISDLGVTRGSVICPMRRTKTSDEFHEQRVLLHCLGILVCQGSVNADYMALNKVHAVDSKRIVLPPYPLVRRHVPYYPNHSVLSRHQLNERGGALNGRHLRINSATHPDIAQHVIKDEPIMPAAGYLEMVFEEGARQLWNVDFRSLFSLSSSYPAALGLELDGIHFSVVSYSDSETKEGRRLHAEGYLSREPEANSFSLDPFQLSTVLERCSKVDISDFYESLKYFANYGPPYQRIMTCYKGKHEVLAEVRGTTDDLENSHQYVFHPAILDSCFHVAVHRMLTGSVDNNEYYLPSHADNVYISEALVANGPPAVLYVHVMFRRWHPDHLVYDFTIVDESGILLCSIHGFEVARHKSIPDASIRHRFDIVNEVVPPEKYQRLPNGEKIGYGDTTLHVLQFKRGHEMDLKRALQGIDRNKLAVLWVFAGLGKDGAAAQGFTRSLRREVFIWDIHLVLLPQDWDVSSQYSMVKNLAVSEESEAEVVVANDGSISVPRVSESPAPSAPRFDTNALWSLNKRLQLEQARSYHVPEGCFLITVEFTSALDFSLRGIVGRVAKGEREGSKVMGIVPSHPISNYVVLHEGRFNYIDDGTVASPELALGAFAAFVSLGASTLARPSRLKGKTVLVTNASSSVGRGLRHVLTVLDIKHNLVGEISETLKESLMPYDIIVSGATRKAEIQLLTSMASGSSLVFWNNAGCGLQAVYDREVWAVQDSLELVRHMTRRDYALETGVSPTGVLSSEVDLDRVTVFWRLFDPEKTYVLIGGIGSLGMTIAVWMYRNGARRIVMTSRNGLASSSLAKNDNAVRMLDYLQSLYDLELRLENCDATSRNDMRRLLASIDSPLGGCMLLSAILSDRTFFAHNEETYEVPFKPKAMAFEVLEGVIDIGKLDFFVTFSSGTLFGNAGQTNYSSANTLTDELTRKYPNAFALVTPVILDSTIALDSTFSKLKNLLPWGITSEALCTYIGDGIRKLADGAFWLYIPDLNWNIVYSSLGSSSLYDHLAVKPDEAKPERSEKPPLPLKEIVLAHLDVKADDLSPNVPLTSYGLDSLSAARLSFDLQPLLSVTQLQLLANVSLSDLESRARDSPPPGKTAAHQSGDGSDFNWAKLNQPGETIVKLRDLDGIPLILLHGASGIVTAFRPLQEHFSTPLWAIQTTPETPFQSISAIARFYFDQIKKQRPDGPYRVGGFSGTSLITFEIVRLLEANGDEVVQLVFLDHFPMLFCSPIWTWDDETIREGRPSNRLVAQQAWVICTAIRGDPAVNRHSVADALMDAASGKGVRPHIRHFYETLKVLVDMVMTFLLDLSGGDLDLVQDALVKWISGIKVPFTVYVASSGIRRALPAEEWNTWSDFGTNVIPSAKVVTVEGDHYSFMESKALSDSLQHGWQWP